MPPPRQILDRTITLSEALRDETNILHKLTYSDQRLKFFTYLYTQQPILRQIVAHHLGLNPHSCRVAEVHEWLHGSYNVCVPVTIDPCGMRVIARLPLPFRVGEYAFPGNADEKLRCEAGAYAWLQENCPSVPIPRLYGFGLSTGRAFTSLEKRPLLIRLTNLFYRKCLQWLGWPAPSKYLRHDLETSAALKSGYLVLEYIEKEEGEMLSRTWEQGRNQRRLRNNLFRGLSQILIELARIPLPRIGSWIISDEGYLKLENRPITSAIYELENEGIHLDIPRDKTYSSVSSYVFDILNIHDKRLTHQPNSITGRDDCIDQMSALTMMRALPHLFFKNDLHKGPFIFSLADLHPSNIFIDKDWHIRKIVDLEWACSIPIEFIHPPQWLTGQAVDMIDLDDYDSARIEFMNILKEVEQKYQDHLSQRMSLYTIMNEGWKKNSFWYVLALGSLTGLCNLFYDNILPSIGTDSEESSAFQSVISHCWTSERDKFIEKKELEKDDYNARLEDAFQDRM